MSDAVDYTGYKARVRDTWTRGNYAALAELVMPIADELCRVTAVTPNDRVLDVATGTGNVAVAAARLGAYVTALDITPAMVAATRDRAAAEGLTIEVVEGDAEDMQLPANSYDVVLSACGVWWAPRPDVAAQEMARVLRRNGRLGLAGFTHDSYLGQVEEMIKARVPLPPGVPERNEWADPVIAAQRLRGLFPVVGVNTHMLRWSFASGQAAAAFLFANSASHLAALDGLSTEDGAVLVADVAALAERMSVSSASVELAVEYAVVAASLVR